MLRAIELAPDELGELEEATPCSSGLMCLGLRADNRPAFVGWWLDYDPVTTADVPRYAYAWRFDGDPLGGVYCEDCTLEIERLESER